MALFSNRSKYRKGKRAPKSRMGYTTSEPGSPKGEGPTKQSAYRDWKRKHRRGRKNDAPSTDTSGTEERRHSSSSKHGAGLPHGTHSDAPRQRDAVARPGRRGSNAAARRRRGLKPLTVDNHMHAKPHPDSDHDAPVRTRRRGKKAPGRSRFGRGSKNPIVRKIRKAFRSLKKRRASTTRSDRKDTRERSRSRIEAARGGAKVGGPGTDRARARGVRQRAREFKRTGRVKVKGPLSKMKWNKDDVIYNAGPKKRNPDGTLPKSITQGTRAKHFSRKLHRENPYAQTKR